MLFETGSSRGVAAERAHRILVILDYLDNASQIGDLGLPGLALHPLKGDLAGKWTVKVSGNLRIVFEFREEDVFAVDLLDYH